VFRQSNRRTHPLHFGTKPQGSIEGNGFDIQRDFVGNEEGVRAAVPGLGLAFQGEKVWFDLTQFALYQVG